jgi:hypothetical protein
MPKRPVDTFIPPDAFVTVLALPCRAHAAGPGEPCWTVGPGRALCGRRARARGFNAKVSSRSLGTWSR